MIVLYSIVVFLFILLIANNRKRKIGIEGSIAKWENIANGVGVDRGARNCPLCIQYLQYSHVISTCFWCPVYKLTNNSNCQGTPYTDWVDYHTDTFPIDLLDGRGVHDDESKRLAQAELDFLRIVLSKHRWYRL